jgi:predicted Zn finger-like uncharacterized protein
MAITVECSNCGRRYNVDDSIAGKTVKCRQCGNLITVPRSASEGLDPDVDLNTLSALAEAPMGDEQAAMQRMPRVDARPGSEERVAGDEEPQTFGRPNFRFTFPYARQVDQYLPMILAVIGIFVAGFVIVQNDTSQRAWMVVLRFLVVFLTYTFVACPLALVGLTKAARAMRYQLPKKPKWRTFTVFMPALMLGIFFWFLGQNIVGLILGIFSGLILAAGLIWLLFRLRPHEIVTTGVYGAVGFLSGAVLAGGVLFLINLLTLNVFTSMKKASALPGSPLGELFSWAAPVPESDNAPVKHGPTTRKIETAPNPVVPAPTTVALAPEPTPTSTPTTETTPEPTTTAIAPPPEPTPVTPPSPVTPVETTPSPFVKDVKLVEAPGAFQEVIEPAIASPAFNIAKVTPEGAFHVELWNSADWTKKGTFTPAANTRDQYIVSPSGDLLVRIARFPGLSAQLYSFSAGAVTKTVELETPVNGALPELLAMPTEDRLLVRWVRGGANSIESIDISTNKRKLVDMVTFDPRPRGWTVSPFESGRWFAVPTNIGGPQVFVYDLNGVRPIRKFPITGLDPSQYTPPTGITFSNEKRLAILLEREGNGLLLDWDMNTYRLAHTHIFANGPVPGRANQIENVSSLEWLPGMEGWLIYGQRIFDTISGKAIGDLGVPHVRSARFTDLNNPEHVVLTCQPPGVPLQLMDVKLNVEEIKSALDAAKKSK